MNDSATPFPVQKSLLKPGASFRLRKLIRSRNSSRSSADSAVTDGDTGHRRIRVTDGYGPQTDTGHRRIPVTDGYGSQMDTGQTDTGHRRVRVTYGYRSQTDTGHRRIQVRRIRVTDGDTGHKRIYGSQTDTGQADTGHRRMRVTVSVCEQLSVVQGG